MDKTKRLAQINIRITADEKRTLEAAAKRQARTLSDWIRLAALAAARRKA